MALGLYGRTPPPPARAHAVCMAPLPSRPAASSITFFKPQPKIGAYCAAPVPAAMPGAARGTAHAVLAADTLLPEGSGQPFSEEDQQFIACVAKVCA